MPCIAEMRAIGEMRPIGEMRAIAETPRESSRYAVSKAMGMKKETLTLTGATEHVGRFGGLRAGLKGRNGNEVFVGDKILCRII